MKLRHGIAISLSGLLWMGVGIFLLVKGFSLILTPTYSLGEALFLPQFFVWTQNAQQAGLLLLAVGLCLGFLKGRFVLNRTASRVIGRIVSLPNPAPVLSLYTPSYLLLLASMVLLGLVLKWIPLPFDLKGVIDIAIGSALTNASSHYFRYLAVQKKEGS